MNSIFKKAPPTLLVSRADGPGCRFPLKKLLGAKLIFQFYIITQNPCRGKPDRGDVSERERGLFFLILGVLFFAVGVCLPVGQHIPVDGGHNHCNDCKHQENLEAGGFVVCVEQGADELIHGGVLSAAGALQQHSPELVQGPGL